MNPAFEIENTTLVKYTGTDTEIMIPEGITEIGERAFAGNDKIAAVKMPDSVIKIGSNAFNKCTKLKTVAFSRNLEEIGYEAFCRCKGLKEIDLPDTIRYLGGGAFASCDKLHTVRCESKVFEPGNDPFSSYDEKTPAAMIDENGFLIFLNVLFKFVNTGNVKEVIVPDGVTHIVSGVFRSGAYSWEEKNGIEKAVLPQSVREIGISAFANCAQLKSIEMPAGITFGLKAFSGCTGLGDENGFFIHDGIVLGYYGNSETVQIPQGVRIIAPEIFSNGYEANPGNKNIRKVILPEGLEVIGSMAFQNCDLMEQIEIPESVHTIGNSAFAGCDHLARVTLPAHVENMGDGVFSGCRLLADENGFAVFNNTLYGFFSGERNVVVPEGITAISNGCFEKMGILSISLPSTLKKLGHAFSDCDMLEEITIPEGVESISGTCFRRCAKLRNVTLPSTVKSIGYAAFAGCSALEQIVLPEALERIDSNAFEQCTALKEIALPAGITTLDNYVFQNCSNLEQVTLPAGLEKIGSSSFKGCKKLRVITMPASVTSIGYTAFSGCESLEALHFENFSCAVDPTAFAGCPKLADKDGFTIVGDILWKYTGAGGDVVVPEGIRELAADVFREGHSRNFRAYFSYRPTGSLKSLILPTTLQKIGANALDGCSALASLEIPAGVQIIEDQAFRESGLKKVQLPEHIEVIGNEAFLDCKKLVACAIPASVTHIGMDTFRGCKSLKSLDVHPDNPAYASCDGILTNKAGDTLILFPAGKKPASYEIPNHFVTIATHAFISCEKLTKIVIPASVQNIGDEAFPRRDWRGTTGLQVIEADPAAGGGTIGKDVFDLPDWSDTPLCYPKLPVTMVKEQTVQLLLGLAYCLNPEKYEAAYAEGYRKYCASHEKSLLKKADAMHIPEAAKYFGTGTAEKKKTINYKKLSDQAKVELLEQAVLANDIEQAKTVIAGCGSFEFTARALGLACLYSSLDMVKLLVENGATFEYEYTPLIKRRYGAAYCTKYSQYPVNYSELIAKTSLNIYNPIMFASVHEYHFADLPATTARANSGKLRAEIAEYLCGAESAKFNASLALSCALFWGCTELAERLLQPGISVTYGVVLGLTETDASADRNEYMLCLAALPPEKALFALEKLADLLDAMDKKIIMMPKAFEEKNSSLLDASVIPFLFRRTDTSRLTKSKLLEAATDKDDVQAVAALVNAGIFKTTAMRDKAIQYAMDQGKTEVLAWLMDYKNKTADLAAEAARKEERIMRELMEDPNSVSAMKKIWGYKKLENGTLQITGYKGSDEHVEIPAKIGKAQVTVIGKEAFSGSEYGRSKNYEARRMIRSIVIPEGVTEIGDHAFFLCESLESIAIPPSVKIFGESAFSRCDKLRDEKGFLILNGVVRDYTDPAKAYKNVVIPEGVKEIAPRAFRAKWSSSVYNRIQSLTLPESLEEIGEEAFAGLKNLKSIHIPAGVVTIGKRAFAESGLTAVTFSEGVKTICDQAFALTQLTALSLPDSLESIGSRALYSCRKLRDLYVPASLENIGEELLGNYGDADGHSWSKYIPSGIYVYTPAGSAAEAHMKQYSAVYVSNEYPEKETKG